MQKNKKFDDYNFVIDRVTKNGNELYYASKELKDNYNIVYKAVENNGESLKYASKRLKSNFDIIEKSIEQNGYYVENALGVDDNFFIFKKAVSNNPYSIKFASQNLKNNKELIKIAGINKLESLYYIEDKHKKNREIVNEIMKLNNQKNKRYFNQKLIDYKIFFEHLKNFDDILWMI